MQLNFITLKGNNQWLKIAIFFLLLLLAISFFVFKYYREMSDLYVDSNYHGWFKWGSEKHPYSSICKSFDASRKKISPVKIHLKNGEYYGNIEIPENIKLYGENRDTVILKGDNLMPTVAMGNNASIYNLSVIGGHTGILAKDNAVIENCSIREFKKIGVDAASNETEIIISNSEIGNSNGKGFYAQRGRKIKIIGSEIHDNEEEGLDLRQVVSGEIARNKIYNNGESGIESVACGSRLLISNNEIVGNKSNGITFQYYEDEDKDAEIIIEKNRISAADSEHFAISVANPSGEKNKPENFWRNSIKIYDDNILEGRVKTRSLDITSRSENDK